MPIRSAARSLERQLQEARSLESLPQEARVVGYGGSWAMEGRGLWLSHVSLLLHGVDGEAALPRGCGEVEVGGELARLGRAASKK